MTKNNISLFKEVEWLNNKKLFDLKKEKEICDNRRILIRYQLFNLEKKAKVDLGRSLHGAVEGAIIVSIERQGEYLIKSRWGCWFIIIKHTHGKSVDTIYDIESRR